MYARLTYEGVSAWPFRYARIPKGKTFTVELKSGVPDGLSWPAAPDEVLAIKEAPDGRSAEITATAVGLSIIEIQRGAGTQPLMLLSIEVYEDNSDEAVSFTSTVGAEIPDP